MCTIVALNPNTGKMAGICQVTPHDTHDWTLRRPFSSTANQWPSTQDDRAGCRNGHYFLLIAPRASILTAKYLDALN
jgi:hypothetical protein